MNSITIDFLSFEGCPLAPKVLEHLQHAIKRLSSELQVSINEVDLMDPATPESLRRWGSPTILLNDQDISGAEPGNANNCRIYAGPGGVLSEQEIIEALTEKSGN